MVILDVGLEVIRETVDPMRQQRDLHFRRSGVALGALIFADHFGLVLGRHCHFSNSLRSVG
jgi:hypothetical protein